MFVRFSVYWGLIYLGGVMKEPCIFYSGLISKKQHDELNKLRRELGLSLANVVRQSIDCFIESKNIGSINIQEVESGG